ncbi:MAG: hypothetical protein HC819_21895 [Cyclobacteriaceae bacterium]|nr:hypothetical protein [Cyclobacteriaceae bacterium]
MVIVGHQPLAKSHPSSTCPAAAILPKPPQRELSAKRIDHEKCFLYFKELFILILPSFIHNNENS